MWRSLALTLMILAGWSAEAKADAPVVVELYTSQGCSSCPPADAFLAELANRDDVIALGLHVDYWDYIGWKDVFGSKVYADRQRAYARVGGRRSVYTPQMIVQGQEHVVGNHPKEVGALIRRYQAAKPEVALVATREGETVAIRAQAGAATKRGPVSVVLMRYAPKEVTRILRGENAGKEIIYVNVVREMKTLKTWDMRQPLQIKTPSSKGLKTAIILQRAGYGPVLAATRVD